MSLGRLEPSRVCHLSASAHLVAPVGLELRKMRRIFFGLSECARLHWPRCGCTGGHQMEHALLFAGGGSCSHLFGGAPIVLGLLPLLEHALLFINSVLVAVVIAIDTPDLMGLIRLAVQSLGVLPPLPTPPGLAMGWSSQRYRQLRTPYAVACSLCGPPRPGLENGQANRCF